MRTPSTFQTSAPVMALISTTRPGVSCPCSCSTGKPSAATARTSSSGGSSNTATGTALPTDSSKVSAAASVTCRGLTGNMNPIQSAPSRAANATRSGSFSPQIFTWVMASS